jgi:Tyrosine phosphatase family
MTIGNFRLVVGFSRLYRSSNISEIWNGGDDIAPAAVGSAGRDRRRKISSSDVLPLVERAGLIIDLRTARERRSVSRLQSTPALLSKSQDWKCQRQRQYPILQRLVLRLDPLSPTSDVIDYIDTFWLASAPPSATAVDSGLLERHCRELQSRGLFGLNQLLLGSNCGRKCWFEALCAITQYFEEHRQHQQRSRATDDGLVIFHCVQGKDRTGMLAMLCQCVVGVHDDVIVDDYHVSHQVFPPQLLSPSTEPSAALTALVATTNGRNTTPSSATTKRDRTCKFDYSVFEGAPREVLIQTLSWLCERYNSGKVEGNAATCAPSMICAGYLTDIGFHHDWQNRFRRATLQSRLFDPRGDGRQNDVDTQKTISRL